MVNLGNIYEDREDFEKAYYWYLEAALADNEEELKAVSTLLKYSVSYINNYNRNGVSDRSELDAWLKIMKQ